MHAKTEERLVDIVPVVAGMWGVVVRPSGVHSIASVPSLDLLDDVNFFKWELKCGSDDLANTNIHNRNGTVGVSLLLVTKTVNATTAKMAATATSRNLKASVTAAAGGAAGRRCSCKSRRKRDMVKKMMLSPASTNARTRFFVLSHAIFGVELIEERRNVMKSTGGFGRIENWVLRMVYVLMMLTLRNSRADFLTLITSTNDDQNVKGMLDQC
nr:hypothetical protein Iba_chr13dCG10740 [Ipomoea batatas]